MPHFRPKHTVYDRVWCVVQKELGSNLQKVTP